MNWHIRLNFHHTLPHTRCRRTANIHQVLFTLGPTASTTPTPSWPGTPGSSGVNGYLPSMVLMSEGLMGACRVEWEGSNTTGLVGRMR